MDFNLRFLFFSSFRSVSRYLVILNNREVDRDFPDDDFIPSLNNLLLIFS